MTKADKLRWLMNCWPPFIGAGIKVETVSADFRHVRVRLKAGRFRRNYVGTHFGGSLFAMTDPYWMIMVMENLGRDYLVSAAVADIGRRNGRAMCDAGAHEVRGLDEPLHVYVPDTVVLEPAEDDGVSMGLVLAGQA